MIRLTDNHEYMNDAGDKFPSVTQIIKDAGLMGDCSWYTDESRQRGEYVHKATELDDNENLDYSTLDPVIVPYLDAWRKFKADSGIEILGIEGRFINSSYAFAGTIDRCCIMNGNDTIVDIKTGPIMPWVAIQTAGYMIGINKIVKRCAVQLTGDGTYKVQSFNERKDANIFCAALSLYNWKKRNLK